MSDGYPVALTALQVYANPQFGEILATMTIDFTFFAFAIPAVLFAGISKGGFGSGAAFAATPFLALILEPAQAVGLMLPLLMLMDIGALRPFWKKWDWPSCRALIVGAIPGIMLGIAFFRVANPDVIRFLIGSVAVAFVCYRGAKSIGWLRPAKGAMSDRAGMLAGAIAGFTSFVSHASGPPAAIFLLSRSLSKTGFQATTVIVFWAVNMMKFAPYVVLGIISEKTFIADLYLAPVALLGVWAGVRFHRMVSENIFFLITYVLLLTTGSKLIWDALV